MLLRIHGSISSQNLRIFCKDKYPKPPPPFRSREEIKSQEGENDAWDPHFCKTSAMKQTWANDQKMMGGVSEAMSVHAHWYFMSYLCTAQIRHKMSERESRRRIRRVQSVFLKNQCGLKIILRTLYVHLKSVSNLILGESSRYLWRIAEEIELVRVITWAEVLELSYNFCQDQKFIATHRVMLGSQIHRIHWWCFGIILRYKPSQIWSFQNCHYPPDDQIRVDIQLTHWSVITLFKCLKGCSVVIFLMSLT